MENFEDGQHQPLEANDKPNRSDAGTAGTAIEKSVKLMIYRRTEEQPDKSLLGEGRLGHRCHEEMGQVSRARL